jgi:hypothetical protein
MMTLARTCSNLLYVFVVLDIEPKASPVLNTDSTTELYSAALSNFEIASSSRFQCKHHFKA